VPLSTTADTARSLKPIRSKLSTSRSTVMALPLMLSVSNSTILPRPAGATFAASTMRTDDTR